MLCSCGCWSSVRFGGHGRGVATRTNSGVARQGGVVELKKS